MNVARLRVVLRFAAAAVALVAVVLALRSLARTWHEATAQAVAWSPRPGWILLAVLTAAVVYGILIEAWRRVLGGYGESLAPLQAARIWILSSFGKYLPGKLWIVAGMAVLAQRAGISASSAVAAAIIMQMLNLASGVAVGAALLPGALSAAGTAYIWGAALVGGVSAAAVFLLGSGKSLALLQRWLPDGAPRLAPATPGALLAGFLANVAAWTGYGLSMVFLSRGLFAGATLSVADAVGAFAVSYLVGLLALLVPGGLVVREALFAALLAPSLGVRVALALAVASRLMLTIIDLTTAVLCTAGPGRTAPGVPSSFREP